MLRIEVLRAFTHAHGAQNHTFPPKTTHTNLHQHEHTALRTGAKNKAHHKNKAKERAKAADAAVAAAMADRSLPLPELPELPAPLPDVQDVEVRGWSATEDLLFWSSIADRNIELAATTGEAANFYDLASPATQDAVSLYAHFRVLHARYLGAECTKTQQQLKDRVRGARGRASVKLRPKDDAFEDAFTRGLKAKGGLKYASVSDMMSRLHADGAIPDVDDKRMRTKVSAKLSKMRAATKKKS